MFGNPTWFRPKIVGWGIRPATWQGWAYTAGWIGVMVVPFWMLLLRSQGLEALAWLGCSLGLLWYDVAQIRRSLIPPVVARPQPARSPNDGIWFLGDETPRIATQNFDLKLKR